MTLKDVQAKLEETILALEQKIRDEPDALADVEWLKAQLVEIHAELRAIRLENNL